MTDEHSPASAIDFGSLADREARLRAILESAVEGIITIDENGIVESINPAAERIFGYSASEVIGKNVSLLMPSPDRERHDDYIRHYRETGVPKIIGRGREVVGRRKDGTTFPMQLSVSEVRLSTGRMFTGFVHDLTQRVAAEEKLRELAAELEHRVEQRTRELQVANEELMRKDRLAILGQLAGGVAHEIRNPLGVIRNVTYFLRQVTDENDGQLKDSFEEIERALASSNHIVSELLDYARDPKPDQKAFLISEVVDDAIATLHVGEQIALEKNSDPSLCCLGDRYQVERILVNLLGNALQAMPFGGTLSVAISGMPDAVCVAVTDTGVGIPDEHLEKIFDPLFTQKTKGIGLGLAISRRYAELNRGKIEVASTVGKGSTFRLTLPRAAFPTGGTE